jgi:putative transposase
MCESFFATLECELLDRVPLPTPERARAVLFTWIEGWYNSRRRHSALDYEAPITFEQHAVPETAA